MGIVAAEIAGGEAQMGLCLLCSSQDEQGWAQTSLLLPCQLPRKSHVAHVVTNYKILLVTSRLVNKVRTDSNLTLINDSNTGITDVEKTALAQEQPLDK